MNPPWLSPQLVEELIHGQIILFLGSGASLGTSAPDGKKALTGPQLGSAIATKFLDGRRSTDPLRKIADLAISESSLSQVQVFVKSLFDKLEPASFHKFLPKFRWHSIFTTNYDFLVEQSYAADANKKQEIQAIIRDGDNFRNAIGTPNALPLIKLHGCLSQINDPSLPLILSNDQYSKYAVGRKRLTDSLREYGTEWSIIFCGYDLSDPHIQTILFDLCDGGVCRPRYWHVNPALDEMDDRYWSHHRITTVKSTFEDFLKSLDRAVPEYKRSIGQLFEKQKNSLSRWMDGNLNLSDSTTSILFNRLEHVYKGMPISTETAWDFYRGNSDSWSAIDKSYDVGRGKSDEILVDWVTRQNDSVTNLIILQGYAGSGKSVSLRRMAWTAANENNAVVFFSNGDFRDVAPAIQEFSSICKQKIFLFVDDIMKSAELIADAIQRWRDTKINITIIAGIRTNEWNNNQKEFGIVPDDNYELGGLSEREVRGLLGKLELNMCLGKLAEVDFENRVKLFMDDHDRQILVALHELTEGRSFQEILKSEWRNIEPNRARQLYLDICSMHKFGVNVRAGFVSRLNLINFEEFKLNFFKPLENVVKTAIDPISRDLCYRSRHPHVADIVFEAVLSDPGDRADQLIRIISGLNVEFDSDDRVARALISGRKLAETFSDTNLIERIFQASEATSIDKSFVLHQRAVFELQRKGGNPTDAMRLLESALAIAKQWNRNSIIHTQAVALRRLANLQKSGPLANRLRDDAIKILIPLLRGKNSRAYSTLCEVLLDQVKEPFNEIGISKESQKDLDALVVKRLGELDKFLLEGLQRFPDDDYFKKVQAEVAQHVSGTPRAVEILKAANDRNPGNEMLAARCYDLLASFDPVDAKRRLNACLKLAPNSKTINFRIAEMLIKEGEISNALMISRHLRRSFTRGDSNIEAQFACARHEFVYGERSFSKVLFNDFKNRRLPLKEINRWRGVVFDGDIKKKWSGEVIESKASFCFVRCRELGEDIFVPASGFSSSAFLLLMIGDNIYFNLAFSFRGPLGINCVPVL